MCVVETRQVVLGSSAGALCLNTARQAYGDITGVWRIFHAKIKGYSETIGFHFLPPMFTDNAIRLASQTMVETRADQIARIS